MCHMPVETKETFPEMLPAECFLRLDKERQEQEELDAVVKSRRGDVY